MDRARVADDGCPGRTASIGDCVVRIGRLYRGLCGAHASKKVQLYFEWSLMRFVIIGYMDWMRAGVDGLFSLDG